jgi:colicin import membrane protein
MQERRTSTSRRQGMVWTRQVTVPTRQATSRTNGSGRQTQRQVPPQVGRQHTAVLRQAKACPRQRTANRRARHPQATTQVLRQGTVLAQATVQAVHRQVHRLVTVQRVQATRQRAQATRQRGQATRQRARATRRRAQATRRPARVTRQRVQATRQRVRATVHRAQVTLQGLHRTLHQSQKLAKSNWRQTK